MIRTINAGILGPIILLRDGHNHVPSAPKPRQLLAFLMLNANQIVRASDCVHELWDTQPPPSAISTLQTYVLRLRRALADTSADELWPALTTVNQGYRLVASRQHLDHLMFDDLARRGSDAMLAGDDARASALFADALRLWRGPAFVDVPPGPLSSPHLVKLHETRNYVLEQRIEADLRLGRHGELLAELNNLTRARPTHENLHAQFMVALYRAGRVQHALKVFRNLCWTLDEHLGIEPSPRMRRLHLAVQTEHPALQMPGAGACERKLA